MIAAPYPWLILVAAGAAGAFLARFIRSCFGSLHSLAHRAFTLTSSETKTETTARLRRAPETSIPSAGKATLNWIGSQKIDLDKRLRTACVRKAFPAARDDDAIAVTTGPV